MTTCKKPGKCGAWITGLLACVLILPGSLLWAQDYPTPPPATEPSDMDTPYEPPVNAQSPPEAEAAPDTEAPPPEPSPGVPPGHVNFQTFYNSLANEGTWIQTPGYGYVWQPSVNDPQWAPYTDGHWVYTQDGWTWVSDEPWGWATFHYGRWVNLDGVGWCWVPGYVWGPAWVSWRYGDGYVGWAPLPPDSLVGVDYEDDDDSDEIGFHIGGDCDSFYGIGAGYYNFLPIAILGESNYRGYYVNRYSNYRLINHTVNVTNINVNRTGARNTFSGISVGGPLLLQVNAVAQTPVPRVNLTFNDRPGPSVLGNGTLAVFAPRVDAAGTSALRPATVSRSLAETSINRGVDISRPLLVNARLGVTGPTETQIREAQSAQAEAPAEAKVATSTATVPSTTTRSFLSMRPGETGGSSARSVQTYESSPSYRPPASGYAAPGNYSSPYSPGGDGYRAPSGGGYYHGGSGGFPNNGNRR